MSKHQSLKALFSGVVSSLVIALCLAPAAFAAPEVQQPNKQFYAVEFSQDGGFGQGTYLSAEGDLSTLEAGPYERLEADIVNALVNVEATLDVSAYNIDFEDFGELYYRVVESNPQLFYVTTGFTGYGGEYYLTEVEFMYKCAVSEIPALSRQYEARVQEALSWAPRTGTDIEKMKAVHDWLCVNVTYNAATMNTGYPDNDWVYSSYGALVRGDAVCQGYGLAFEDLCNRMGLTCVYVSSDAMKHGWCMVQLDGQWYHVDPTWDDDDYYNYISQEYFVKSTAYINADRDADARHYGWLPAYSATDTRYDSSWWTTYGGPAADGGMSACKHANKYPTGHGEASCEEGAYNQYFCPDCNETVKEYTSEALGHQFAAGLCQRCGQRRADVVTIGANRYTMNVAPYDTWAPSSMVQLIYGADELATGGAITSLSFNVRYVCEQTAEKLKVYLGTTSKDEFVSEYDEIPLKDMTLVFSGSMTIGVTEGWETITLDRAFNYNGVENLVVAICRDDQDSHNDMLDYWGDEAEGTRLLAISGYSMDDQGSVSGVFDRYAVDYLPCVKVGVEGCAHSRLEPFESEGTCLKPAQMGFVCRECGVSMVHELGLGGHAFANGVCEVCGALESRIVEIGMPTEYGSQGAPYGSYYCYSAAQMLYTAQQLGGAGTINSVAFNVVNADNFPTRFVRIYMGTVPLERFESADQYVSANDLTLVYSGAPELGVTEGWEELRLDAPYQYDGSGSLVVMVCRASDGWSGYLSYAVTDEKGALLRADDGNPSIADSYYDGGYVMTETPCIRLDMSQGTVLKRGDVNGNGVVNIVDAQLAYDIATTDLYSGEEYDAMRARADVAGDAGVYAEDAFAIQCAALRGW